MAVNPIQIQKFLKGVDYPASKSDLLRNAEREGPTRMSARHWSGCRMRSMSPPPM